MAISVKKLTTKKQGLLTCERTPPVNEGGRLKNKPQSGRNNCYDRSPKHRSMFSQKHYLYVQNTIFHPGLQYSPFSMLELNSTRKTVYIDGWKFL